MSLPTDFGAFLAFVGTAGAVGAVLSLMAQYWPFFIGLKPINKRIVMFLISVVMGIASHWAVQYVPASVIADFQPYYSIILFAIAMVGGNQLYYSVVVKRSEQAKAIRKYMKTVGLPEVTPEAWGWTGGDSSGPAIGFAFRPGASAAGIDTLLSALDAEAAARHRISFLRQLGIAAVPPEAQPTSPS